MRNCCFILHVWVRVAVSGEYVLACNLCSSSSQVLVHVHRMRVWVKHIHRCLRVKHIHSWLPSKDVFLGTKQHGKCIAVCFDLAKSERKSYAHKYNHVQGFLFRFGFSLARSTQAAVPGCNCVGVHQEYVNNKGGQLCMVSTSNLHQRLICLIGKAESAQLEPSSWAPVQSHLQALSIVLSCLNRSSYTIGSSPRAADLRANYDIYQVVQPVHKCNGQFVA